jgi:hypothetical protein
MKAVCSETDCFLVSLGRVTGFVALIALIIPFHRPAKYDIVPLMFTHLYQKVTIARPFCEAGNSCLA